MDKIESLLIELENAKRKTESFAGILDTIYSQAIEVASMGSLMAEFEKTEMKSVRKKRSPEEDLQVRVDREKHFKANYIYTALFSNLTSLLDKSNRLAPMHASKGSCQDILEGLKTVAQNIWKVTERLAKKMESLKEEYRDCSDVQRDIDNVVENCKNIMYTIDTLLQINID